MSNLTPERLNEIEKAASAATPGPWEATLESPIMSGRKWNLRREGVPGIILSGYEYANHWLHEHIANMDPATTLALLARLRELEAQAGRVQNLARDLEAGAAELKDNSRFGESGICKFHARKIREALGEEA